MLLDGEIVMRLIDLNALACQPELAATVPRGELTGERARAAACLAALDSAQSSAPEPVEQDRVLSETQAPKLYPVTRRWLFQHDNLPFIKRLSRKKLAISERGLRRHLGIKS